MAVAAFQSYYREGTVQIGDLELESGKTLKMVEIAYERVGPVDAPAILVTHALTGNQYAVGEGKKESWWSGLIGAHRWIDTNQFQVITTNVIGGCSGSTGPNSINPATGKLYRTQFPFITIRDIVRAQYIALRQLGIDHLHAVIGGSLGGMQVLEWGIMYPTFMNVLIPIAVTPYLSDFAIAFNAIARRAILQDPAWKNGNYNKEEGEVVGLSIARMLGMVTYRSSQLFNQRFNRKMMENWGKTHDEVTFEVESYLLHQGEKLIQRFDANSYLYLLKAMDSHDIGRDRGGWQQALSLMKATVLAIGFKGDLLYPPEQLKHLTDAYQEMGNKARFFEIDTEYGHDGFLVEFEKWGGIIRQGLYENKKAIVAGS